MSVIHTAEGTKSLSSMIHMLIPAATSIKSILKQKQQNYHPVPYRRFEHPKSTE